jgi:hypothetical protein
VTSLSNIAFKSWPSVLDDMDWFVNNGQGKKIYFDEVSNFLLHYHAKLTIVFFLERLAVCYLA